jgi:hypothetical protein
MRRAHSSKSSSQWSSENGDGLAEKRAEKIEERMRDANVQFHSHQMHRGGGLDPSPMRCGITPSANGDANHPVTLATGTDGVTKTASTGVRSSTYLLSRDTASSSVTFMVYGFVWIFSGADLCSLLLLRPNLLPSRFLKCRKFPAGGWGRDALHRSRSRCFRCRHDRLRFLTNLCPSRLLRQRHFPPRGCGDNSGRCGWRCDSSRSVGCPGCSRTVQ